MSTATPTAPNESQAAVLALPPEARAVVTAGPGAGKTFTLLARAEALRELPEVGNGRILVLSFTRAVVAELRKRDLERGAVTPLLAETFDSFASRMLKTYAIDDAWQGAGYDGRIEACTELIRAGALDDYLLEQEHILLDEIQDLVGVRARFVRALLETYPGGFTAFGDPAQAIYDYADDIDGEGSVLTLTTSAGLAEFELSLSGNHRFGDADGEARASRLHARLIDDAAGAAELVAAEVAALPAADGLPDAAGDSTRTAAILCRRNLVALQISGALWEIGVPNTLRRRAGDRPTSGWVAALFDGHPVLARKSFALRFEELATLAFPGLPPQGTAWDLLCRSDPAGRGRQVAESAVRTRILTGRVPWGFLEQPVGSLVISSIHGAKGLEFDECLISDWEPWADENPAEEARVRFVALTRARNRSFRIHWDKSSRNWFSEPTMGGRHIKRGREPWQTFGFEILGDDLHAADPCGGLLLPSASAADAQAFLVQSVRAGDPVDLDLLGDHAFGGAARPIYKAVHRPTGVPIGVTGEKFGRDLGRRIRGRSPVRITGARVSDLETVAGPPANAEAAGLGTIGLWIRPRLMGLGDVQWAT